MQIWEIRQNIPVSALPKATFSTWSYKTRQQLKLREKQGLGRRHKLGVELWSGQNPVVKAPPLPLKEPSYLIVTRIKKIHTHMVTDNMKRKFEPWNFTKT